jgi:hypothetical protein
VYILPEDGHRLGPKHVVVVHNKIEHEKHLLRTVVLIKVLMVCQYLKLGMKYYYKIYKNAVLFMMIELDRGCAHRILSYLAVLSVDAYWTPCCINMNWLWCPSSYSYVLAVGGFLL